MTHSESIKIIITANAARFYKDLPAQKAADMIYAACNDIASAVELIVGKTYEDDSGDAACKLMAKWIKADRK